MEEDDLLLPGRVETYYYCETCGTKYSDEIGTTEIDVPTNDEDYDDIGTIYYEQKIIAECKVCEDLRIEEEQSIIKEYYDSE